MKTYASTNREINNTLYSKRVLHSSNKNILQKIISNALTTCFLLIPESVNREIKQQRKQHLSAMIVDPDYLKQAWKESLQWVYEHIHFLLWPIPKGIELYKEQWTISKTPCPRLSPWRYGRVFLAWSDAIKWRYTYTMAYKLAWTELSLIEILSNNVIHNWVLIMTLPFSSFIYYMIVKKSDLHYAQEHIYLEKIAKFSDKNEI
jgi:hypothetical protein